jgi:hypothetical protein
MVYQIPCIGYKSTRVLMSNPEVDSPFWKMQVMEFCLLLLMFHLYFKNVVRAYSFPRYSPNTNLTKCTNQHTGAEKGHSCTALLGGYLPPLLYFLFLCYLGVGMKEIKSCNLKCGFADCTRNLILKPNDKYDSFPLQLQFL